MAAFCRVVDYIHTIRFVNIIRARSKRPRRNFSEKRANAEQCRGSRGPQNAPNQTVHFATITRTLALSLRVEKKNFRRDNADIFSFPANFNECTHLSDFFPRASTAISGLRFVSKNRNKLIPVKIKTQINGEN